MKISKLEEGLIEISVKEDSGSKGSNDTNYQIRGKYISGRLKGEEAFSDGLSKDKNDLDQSFSPMKNSAMFFANYAKAQGFIAAYSDGKIEVVRKMDGDN